MLNYLSKKIEGAWALCNSAHKAYCIGSLKSDKSVGNINTAESLKKEQKSSIRNRKGLCHLGQVVVWIKHLCLYIYCFIYELNFFKDHSSRIQVIISVT